MVHHVEKRSPNDYVSPAWAGALPAFYFIHSPDWGYIVVPGDQGLLELK